MSKPFSQTTKRLLSTLLIAGFTAVSSPADDWPQFRGPEGTGYAARGELPNQWSANDYRWTLQLPGAGDGSPVVYEGVIYLLNAEPDVPRRTVFAVAADTGKVLWQQHFDLKPHGLHQRNTFASSTPFVDGTGVYLTWADPEQVTVIALNHDGETRWRRDLGTWQSQHGFAGSPVILDGKLIVFNSQQAEQLQPGEKPGSSHMLALDPATGETIWTTPLTATRTCYGVPALRVAKDGSKQIIGANTGNGIFGLDAATGKMLWNLPVFTARCVSCPLVVGDVVIGSAGSGGGGNHLVAVQPPTGSQASQPRETFRMERNAPYVPTPVVVGSRLFMVDDRGIASCVDGETGDVIWSKRVGGNFGASPIVVGDKLLVISLDGKATVLRAGDEYEELGSFSLGSSAQATPAFADGLLILRVENKLCALPAGGK